MMRYNLGKRVLALLLPLLLVVVWLSGSAYAKPTISGLLMNYNPGGGRLQIKRADGVIKTVKMRPNAIYALNGVEGSPHYFRNGMQVAVRICGSINDDPLQGDLLIDAFSSSAIVQRRASTVGNTTVGTFASVGGANGIASMQTALNPPSVVGPIGLGGGANFRSAIAPNSPGGYNAGAGGLAINKIESANTQKPMASTGLMGGNDSDGNNPYAQNNPYDSKGMMGGMAPGSNGTNAGMAAMVGGDEPKEEQSNGMYVANRASSGPLGMQIAQIQGGLLSIDPRNRVLSVVPNGSMQPVQVKVPAGVPITNSANGQSTSFESLRTGQGIIVSGMSNAAGIIEARQITVSQ